ncbi:hypothetical protein [Acidisoma sp. S159]|uniref:hypothetical protein n=1 Tax=Acidisoma sp. S159 TaxID=1747225 RepID=UPI00131C97CA|nr:hypothetical protein [Acidisoma sp. S159]
MINRLGPESLAGTDFSPIAELHVPIMWFKNDMGVEFYRGQDDLDDYEYATFEIEGRGKLILMRYVNAPTDYVSLLLADNFAWGQTFGATMASIAEELRVPPWLFHWREGGEEASLAAPRSAVAA